MDTKKISNEDISAYEQALALIASFITPQTIIHIAQNISDLKLDTIETVNTTTPSPTKLIPTEIRSQQNKLNLASITGGLHKRTDIDSYMTNRSLQQTISSVFKLSSKLIHGQLQHKHKTNRTVSIIQTHISFNKLKQRFRWGNKWGADRRQLLFRSFKKAFNRVKTGSKGQNMLEDDEDIITGLDTTHIPSPTYTHMKRNEKDVGNKRPKVKKIKKIKKVHKVVKNKNPIND